MQNTVVIDCFPDSVRLYRKGYAVVAIDVIRATTTAITVVAMGRRCFPVPSIQAALLLAARLGNALLVGEQGGSMPCGFDVNNSPAELAHRTDVFRPVILLSSSGTKLIHAAGEFEAAYLACFRNYASLASHLIGRHPSVALIGAGTRGEFREEDQMCCAWIAADLMKAGYRSEDRRTIEIVARWSGASPSACANGKSADYLRKTGQEKDLDFILAQINDLDDAYMLVKDEVVMVPAARRQLEALSNDLVISHR